jgi:hypothetical protein
VKRTFSDEAVWAMQNAAAAKLIEDFPLLLANRQKEVDPSEWEKHGHAIRMRMERRLEAMAAEGDGAFEWRRRWSGKGRRVFVFSSLGKERAKLRGLEHGYFFEHHMKGMNVPPRRTSKMETQDLQPVPEEACKHLLIFSVFIAKGFGSYVWPRFFFELPKTLYPQTYQELRLDTLKVEQIEMTFDQLLLKGYMRTCGTKIVRGREVPLLYPTKKGFKMAAVCLRRMKRYYSLNREVKARSRLNG